MVCKGVYAEDIEDRRELHREGVHRGNLAMAKALRKKHQGDTEEIPRTPRGDDHEHRGLYHAPTKTPLDQQGNRHTEELSKGMIFKGASTNPKPWCVGEPR